MKIVFAALHFGYFRNLESVVEELARRGHHVHLVAERADSAAGGRAIVERLAATFDHVTCGTVPGRETETDEGDIGALARGHGSHLSDVDRAGDHLVPEAGDQGSNLGKAVVALVGDEHAEYLRIWGVSADQPPSVRPAVLPVKLEPSTSGL